MILAESVPIQVVAPEIALAVPTDPPAPRIQNAAIEIERAEAAAPPMSATGPTTRPQPISGPDGRDRYPRVSLMAKEIGTPTITICISANGSVDTVEVTRSSGFPRLDQAAVGIGKEFRFKPATRQGQPAAVCVPYGIKFGIDNP
jgi:protein TonB